jgi:23S rRNA (cytosine1962-C5)-methyltransferase
MMDLSLIHKLENTLAARQDLLADPHNTAVRLFNGFLEGLPGLSVDLYGRTLLVSSHASPAEALSAVVTQAVAFYRSALPWLRCGILKTRQAGSARQRLGEIVFGETPDTRIEEHGVKYALDLLLNTDASFFIDTRSLRRWALDNLGGKRVLNTFAYTGSLGAAALAGGAHRVLHLDQSRHFLSLARQTYALNGFACQEDDFWALDFFAGVSRLKRSGELFDCLFLDPPYFSTSGRGRVDLQAEPTRLVNKVRPLVAHQGWLVVVNNALYLSGADFLRALENLYTDGYMELETLIPVPQDCTGYPHTRSGTLPADPAPFNHATKIAVLRVRRKDGRI